MSKTVRSSDLSRDSAAVFRLAEAGPVEVTRRDGEPLVLTRKSERDQHFTVLNVAADLVAASLGPDNEPFSDRLVARFPWLRFLEEHERVQFGVEMAACARACAAIRSFAPFLLELDAWHRTAVAKAAGFTAPAELDWYEGSVAVSRPGQAR